MKKKFWVISFTFKCDDDQNRFVYTCLVVEFFSVFFWMTIFINLDLMSECVFHILLLCTEYFRLFRMFKIIQKWKKKNKIFTCFFCSFTWFNDTIEFIEYFYFFESCCTIVINLNCKNYFWTRIFQSLKLVMMMSDVECFELFTIWINKWTMKFFLVQIVLPIMQHVW